MDGGPATVGVIASVTRSFCGSCDRTRITAEGTPGRGAVFRFSLSPGTP